MKPKTATKIKARVKPYSAAGESGSVAVRICKLTAANATNATIIATRTPTDSVSRSFIFKFNAIVLFIFG